MRTLKLQPTPPRSQQGVALAVSLVLLLVLTIIGVASLNTTALEEKMSTNIQEDHRAFTAAESGIRIGLDGGVTLDLHVVDTVDQDFVDPDDTSRVMADAHVETAFIGWSPPKRGSGYSAISFQAANFDISSEGTAGAGARSVVHQGVGQIVNKD
ncbi:MAG: PilX N-terminal domain-containing pilus assembly protein [Gammaproteobacteria bacterium]|nr:PilX N-terminal domain-containing pilus assembly protein [Gammaproteobacteria bacterium]MDH3468556.1 PilX N-terminal domain-containing pilus assembly protein [Gammaproteobacteria bacterium]